MTCLAFRKKAKFDANSGVKSQFGALDRAVSADTEGLRGAAADDGCLGIRVAFGLIRALRRIARHVAELGVPLDLGARPLRGIAKAAAARRLEPDDVALLEAQVVHL